VLQDGFDANAWERDLSFDVGAAGADGESETGAKTLYASLVPDQGPKVRAHPDPVVSAHMKVDADLWAQPTPLPSLNNPTPE
jgi:hypothetical protein